MSDLDTAILDNKRAAATPLLYAADLAKRAHDAMPLLQVVKFEIAPPVLHDVVYRISAISIEHIFDIGLNILDTNVTGNDTPEKKKFREGLDALKQVTLASFLKREENFGFKDCTTIAKNASILAKKVALNNVTQDDVNLFTQATQKYKTSHTLAIVLAAIIGAVIGMIAGAAIGIAVGSVPGAFIGGTAGAVVGGAALASAARVFSTMWYTKKEPLNKISAAATEMVPNRPGV